MAKRTTFIKAMLLACALAAMAPAPARAAGKVKVGGYLEFRKGIYLIVDGQRLEATPKTRFDGGDQAASPEAIPLGYEIKAKGKRQADGTIVATKLQAKPNGMDKFESDVLFNANALEGAFTSANEVYEEKANGRHKRIGALATTGPEVERARGILDRLLPAYVDPNAIRIYVVDNSDWNAMALANFSIYVYSGLMKDLDDDELAIVLGHELAHATYEHSRREAAKGSTVMVAGEIAVAAADEIDNPYSRTAAEVAVAVGVGALSNFFSREHEDQADRVGLRYVYEAGFDYTKAPRLWDRFAAKFGDQRKAANFFFGDHSTHSQRALALAQEIQRNYGDQAKDPPTHQAMASSAR